MTETGDSGSFPAEVQLDMFGPPQVQGCEARVEARVESHVEDTQGGIVGGGPASHPAGLSEVEAQQLRLDLEERSWRGWRRPPQARRRALTSPRTCGRG
ncbi:MAG: hypothetical protein J2P50_16255 [Hyphomicrobiaceae bacterium]|nr:hypothetical protein [Hyphomicrobiaceae bacterium]